MEELVFEELQLENTSGTVQVEFEWIGEGLSGDYNENDPEDIPLLRFTVSKKEFAADEYWEPVDDSSYCTQISINTDRGKLESILRSFMAELECPVLEGESTKRLCERLSWTEA